MKKSKCLIAFLLIVSMMLVNAAAVSASDIMPRYDNCSDCSMSFDIVNGIGHIGIDYYAKENFTSFTSTVKVQKRFLGIFWNTIEIADGVEEWVVTSTETWGLFNYSFPMEDTGTYRAVFDIKFYGQDGSVDEIEEKIQKVYE